MLTPLPPASDRLALARWRWPSWRLGTVSVRSSAAFRVTVTITAATPRSSCPRASRTSRRRRARPGRTWNPPPPAAPAPRTRCGRGPPARRSLRTFGRPRRGAGWHHPPAQAPPDPDGGAHAVLRDQLDRPAPERRRGGRVHAMRPDQRRDPVARQPPAQQLGEVVVALGA